MKNHTYQAWLVILAATLSLHANAQYEIDMYNTSTGLLMGREGESTLELKPANADFDGSRILMYQAGDSQGTLRTRTIRLDAATYGSYGSLSLDATVNIEPFGNANSTGIPAPPHPYSMIRLSKRGVTSSQPSYSWNFGVYDQLEYSGAADGTSTDDCVNCVTLAYETGGLAAKYKYIFGSDGNFEIASDARFKENITDVDKSLNKILKLSPKKYHYIWSEKNPNRKSTGFLAQDVQKIFPELVSSIRQPNGKRSLMLNYIGMIPHITKGMQEQQELINQQNKLIKDLQKRLEALEKAN